MTSQKKLDPREQAVEDYRSCRQAAQAAYNVEIEPARDRFQKVMDVIQDMRGSMRLAEQAIQPFISDWNEAQDKAKTVYDTVFKEERDRIFNSRK